MEVLFLGKAYRVGELTQQKLDDENYRLRLETEGFVDGSNSSQKYILTLMRNSHNIEYVNSKVSIENCLSTLEKRLEVRKKNEEMDRTPFQKLRFNMALITEKYNGKMKKPKDFVGYVVDRTVLGKDGKVNATLRTTGTANPIVAFDLFQDSPVVRVNLLNFSTWSLNKELLEVIEEIKQYLQTPVNQRVLEFEDEIKSSNYENIYASLFEDLSDNSVSNQVAKLLDQGE